MEIAFLLLVGACVLAFMLGNEYAKHKHKQRELTLIYQVKETKRGRYRINLYDERGKSMLISSGNGLGSEQQAHDVVQKLKRSQFALNE